MRRFSVRVNFCFLKKLKVKMTFFTFLTQVFVIITIIAFVSKVVSVLRASMKKAKLIDELEKKRDELTSRRKNVVVIHIL